MPFGRQPSRPCSSQLLLLAVGLEVFVQIDAEGVVEQVGGDHEPAESGQRHDLLGPEPGRQAIEEVVGNTVGIDGQLPAEITMVCSQSSSCKCTGVLARIDQ